MLANKASEGVLNSFPHSGISNVKANSLVRTVDNLKVHSVSCAHDSLGQKDNKVNYLGNKKLSQFLEKYS